MRSEPYKTAATRGHWARELGGIDGIDAVMLAFLLLYALTVYKRVRHKA